MELFNESAWYIEMLFNVGMVVLPTLAGVAASGELGAQVIKRTKKVYAEYLRPAIDEPTDPAIMLIATKTGKSPEWVSAQLIDNLDNVVGTLPEEAPKA